MCKIKLKAIAHNAEGSLVSWLLRAPMDELQVNISYSNCRSSCSSSSNSSIKGKGKGKLKTIANVLTSLSAAAT